jgi:hypothetical protein
LGDLADECVDHPNTTSGGRQVTGRTIPHSEFIIAAATTALVQVWVVTGTGHHITKNTHQKTGSVLLATVRKYLEAQG